MPRLRTPTGIFRAALRPLLNTTVTTAGKTISIPACIIIGNSISFLWIESYRVLYYRRMFWQPLAIEKMGIEDNTIIENAVFEKTVISPVVSFMSIFRDRQCI